MSSEGRGLWWACGKYVVPGNGQLPPPPPHFSRHHATCYDAAVNQQDSTLVLLGSLGKQALGNTHHHCSSVLSDLRTRRWDEKLRSPTAAFPSPVVIFAGVVMKASSLGRWFLQNLKAFRCAGFLCPAAEKADQEVGADVQTFPVTCVPQAWLAWPASRLSPVS